MNYWVAEMTNMNLVTPLFDYFEVCIRNQKSYILQILTLSQRKTGLLVVPSLPKFFITLVGVGLHITRSALFTRLSSYLTPLKIAYYR